ncbi:hypothetical protein [Conexibacter woesei]|uniref:hypothetical protein n=1 Tax=Conexibacter woesei TaxID=191495 RepID=UPI0003FE7DD9|nr:hypothetical protein [Conexibacter woesei]
MPRNRHDFEIRLPNGDILIVETKDRDPKVDAAFKAAQDRVREETRVRFEEFRRAQQAA